MKIITSNGIYVQVKDLHYLFGLTNLAYFKKAARVSGSNSNEFVLVTNEEAISFINNFGEIVDFNEINKMGMSALSDYILSYSRSSLYGKDASTEYFLDGLRDVLSFKRGNLGYTIPLIKGETLFDDGSTIVSGSSISGYYYVSGDMTNLKDILIGIFEDVESLDYDVVKTAEITVIRVKNMKKKKKGLLSKIFDKKEGK